MKTKVFVIKGEVYPFDILVSIGQTDKQFINTVCKYLPESVVSEFERDISIFQFNPTTNARTTMLETGQTIIRMKSMPEKAKDHGIIAHEIFHAVEFLFRYVNIPLTDSSNEAYAYLIGFITTKFYENI